MSARRNFRVIVNLSYFFHDHRANARLFINDTINTIKDLEERIKQIFKIKNFYLSSQTEYLPSTEDVGVLQQDDIVWVMQYRHSQAENANASPEHELGDTKKKRSISVREDPLEVCQQRKKKKKKYDTETTELVSCPTSPILRPKKKKKQDIKGDGTVSGMEVVQVVPERKMVDQASPTLENGTGNQPVNISEAPGTISTAVELSSVSSELVEDSPKSHRYKGTLSHYKKQAPVPLVTEKYLMDNKVNIVKIEYVSGGPELVKQLEEKAEVDSSTDQNLIIDESECNGHDFVSEPVAAQDVCEDETMLVDLKEQATVSDSIKNGAEDPVSGNETWSDNRAEDPNRVYNSLQFLHKSPLRPKKLVAPASKEEVAWNETAAVPNNNEDPVDLGASEHSLVHSQKKQYSGIGQLLEVLRSNDSSVVTGESLDSDPNDVVTKRRKRIRKRRKKDKVKLPNDTSSSILETDYVPKPIRTVACPAIHLKFEDEGEVDVSKTSETATLENISVDSDGDIPEDCFYLKEEYILKSPAIKNLLPRVGDIIAFKILRITENFTPEISKYVIGKVIEYEAENKTVCFEILNGIEQCVMPEGRLFIGNGEEEKDHERGNRREYAWADVIDPRLLFPRIVLLLIGLDNAGKTKAANTLAGDHVNSPVPTVGFSVVNLKYLNYDVKVFDLGGGPNIRGIWNQYFVDAHGVIFVIDSSDYSRFEEVKGVLEEVLSNDKISGKPVLLLANKQDHENALDEVDIIECLNIEQLVNLYKCPTLVQSCSASENNHDKLDPGIRKGYEWLLATIVRGFETLNQRVERDVLEQDRKEKAEILEKIKKIKAMQELEQSKSDEDAIESYSDYARKLNGDVENTKVSDEVTIFNYEKADKDDASDDSSITFPPVYHTNLEDSALSVRPRSAVEIVKHQLKLNNNVKRPSVKSRSNKTAPLRLYGDKLPHSARERRRDFVSERRNLRSADDCLFTISNKVPIDRLDHTGCCGHGDNIQLNDRTRPVRKLPPLSLESKNVPSVHKKFENSDTDNVISVVDVD
ncbi:hypothetical protein NQ315_001127 [Exocentrus adspersus]|uniref:ADP-ribosylation factor-like protein 13B n=1 Tax=Exocentrus adspersus TaxID=1586481 RepID=A0AAV8WEF6_9CUCU|nr:hypothetical protein NQ315_001127 [Exocentrus adspersus]